MIPALLLCSEPCLANAKSKGGSKFTHRECGPTKESGAQLYRIQRIISGRLGRLPYMRMPMR